MPLRINVYISEMRTRVKKIENSSFQILEKDNSEETER